MEPCQPCEKDMLFYFILINLRKIIYPLISLNIKSSRGFFTSERTRALIYAWDALFFSSILSSNKGKLCFYCLEQLIEKLSDIQKYLSQEFCSEMILKNKLLNPVKDVRNLPSGVSLACWHRPRCNFWLTCCSSYHKDTKQCCSTPWTIC